MPSMHFPASSTLVAAQSSSRNSLPFLATAAGFVFAFRVCLTFLWFQSDPVRGSAVTVGLSLALFLAVFTDWFIKPASVALRLSWPGPIRWIGIYLLLAAFSLWWTTVPSLAAAAAYWAGTAADVGTVLLLAQHRQFTGDVRYIMKGFIFGALILAAIAWYIPAMDDLRLGNEDYLHPNEIGFILAIAGLFAIYLAHNGKLYVWAAAVLSVTLLRDLSKASITAFALAALFYLMYGSRIGNKVRIAIGVGAAASVVWLWAVVEAYADVYSQGSNVETLTGRTVIWATAMEIALEKPWLGHGFYSFRWLVPAFGSFEAMQAHNELLQQFFCYGVVGVIVTIALYWAFYQQIRRAKQSNLTMLAAATLIFGLVRGLFDTQRFDLSCPLWLMAMVSMALTSRTVQMA